MGNIVVFGATGYTGDLTARSLVDAGEKPVLAARSAVKLAELADELGGLETQVANVDDPASVAALVKPGDVLVSTVGPFTRWGKPALEAAIAAGVPYIDSTGETPFIRSVFDEFGPRADASGATLLTACGYDWVPGNLAGALALRDAGPTATKVEIGYFMSGSADSESMSGGTRASVVEALLGRSFSWSDGRMNAERGAKHLRGFDIGGGKSANAISVGTSEAFGLPGVYPGLLDVSVYLGWFGPMARPMQLGSVGLAGIGLLPPVRSGVTSLLRSRVKGSTGGPDAAARAKSGSNVIAEAFGPGGKQLSRVRVAGVNGYEFTADFLGWAARTAKAGGLKGTGALGPVEAFGLDELEKGVAESGLVRENE